MSRESARAGEERGAWIAPSSLGAILVVTVAWWALALWPSEGVPPAWLLRARQVCFNADGSGLPQASGWMLLIGQPIGMVAVRTDRCSDSLAASQRVAPKASSEST